MERRSFTKLAIASSMAITSFISTLAWAHAINPRPVISLGDNGVEDNLQEIFDSITFDDGNPSTPPLAPVNALTDQIPFALFTNTASGGSVATFVIEIAGNAGSNTFGIYSATDPTKRAQIFSAGDSIGEQKLVSFFVDGKIKVNGKTVATGFAPNFGFYLKGPGGTFFSEDSLNGNNPQALIYQGNNTVTLQLGPESDPLTPGIFTDNEFIIAFEDLDVALPSTDRDYQDLVVMMESIRPSVPEPGTIALLGIGLGGIALARRRRLSKKQ